MWPFERRRDVIRVGRHGLEAWCVNGAGTLILSAEHRWAVDGPPDVDVLGPGLDALIAGMTSSRRPIDLVVESFWMPVLLLPTGGSLWGARQLAPLAQHRIAQLPVASSAGWQWRFDHQPGETHALGYALSPQNDDGLAAWRRQVIDREVSIQPALAWHWRRLQRLRRASDCGWWTCIEQDRALACHLHAGRVQALHAGLSAPMDKVQALKQWSIEALRAGLETPVGGVVSAWRSPAADDSSASGIAWCCIEQAHGGDAGTTKLACAQGKAA